MSHQEIEALDLVALAGRDHGVEGAAFRVDAGMNIR